MKAEQRILVGVTGASGSVYAEHLVAALLQRVNRVYLVFTDSARKVVGHELAEHQQGFSLVRAMQGATEWNQILRVFDNDDLFAPIASGSSAPTAMVVVPCSMGSLARIRHGTSGNLIERAADVCLKQRRPLVICPRETPLNVIHLENMLDLARMGVSMVPPVPAFYQKPQSIQDLVGFVTGRILEVLDIEHDLYRPWNSRMR